MDDNCGYDIAGLMLSRAFGWNHGAMDQLIAEAKKRDIHHDLVAQSWMNTHGLSMLVRILIVLSVTTYIWRWAQWFGVYLYGSAWEYDEKSGQYFIPLFSKKTAWSQLENENCARELRDDELLIRALWFP